MVADRHSYLHNYLWCNSLADVIYMDVHINSHYCLLSLLSHVFVMMDSVWDYSNHSKMMMVIVVVVAVAGLEVMYTDNN